MKIQILSLSVVAAFATSQAGELMKYYFAATKEGMWAEYTLVASGGTKADTSTQRNADEDGHVVIEESMKMKEGPGAGSDSKNTYVMPKDFNLARDGLSYGRFTEKMAMNYGGVVMPVDAATLDVIRNSSKDFRGAMKFEGSEKIGDHSCDRYSYTVDVGGNSGIKETGKLWMDESVPFGVVRQIAKSQKSDGSNASSFEINLQNTGKVQIDAPVVALIPVEKKPAAPSIATLMEAYKAERVAIGISVVSGSGGRLLQLTFKNKTDAELTLKLAKGKLSIEASDPVGAINVVVKKDASIVLPAGESSETVEVGQQPGRGAVEGRFDLSVYEGTLLYTGSITTGTVSK